MSDNDTVLRPRFDDDDGAAAPSYTLHVVDGPDRGLSVTLDPTVAGRSFVGTSEVCQLRLGDPTVSRRHAALTSAGSGLRITDLDSTNGTLVEGVRVYDAVVHEGQLVRLGDTCFRFQAQRGSGAAAPAAKGFGRVVGQSADRKSTRL